MKRFVSLTGPIAAMVALKCPFCLLALAGISAGFGSLVPVIHVAYKITIVVLGGAFLYFLYLRWRTSALPVWIGILGTIGFASLVFQVETETGGVFSLLPVSALTLASIGSFVSRRKTSACGACCEQGDSKRNENEKTSLNPALRESPILEETAISADDEEENMAKRKVEVFTAGCPVCEPVVQLVKQTACPSCEVIVHDLNKGCATNECRDKAKKYGITKLPSVVVDGKLLECCKVGNITEQSLRAAGVGRP